MFRIFKMWNKKKGAFEENLINLILLESINPIDQWIHSDPPIETQTIFYTPDGSFYWCSQTLSDINTIINGH